jgi:hypothetical protein
MVDVDSDATIDADEFKAACGKGLVKKLSNSFRAKKPGSATRSPVSSNEPQIHHP